MKRLNVLIIILVLLAFILWFKIANIGNGIEVYVNYSDENKHQILSETSYVPYYNEDISFVICQSRDGRSPCQKIIGVKHGVEKWYNKGVLEYEDFYDNGILLATNVYYSNGFIRQEITYKNGNIIEKKFYSQSTANELVKAFFYTPNETIKKYYVDNRLVKEERYRGKYLISRKIFDKDGLLKRLEEYSNSNGFEELFNPFLHRYEDMPPNDDIRKYQKEDSKRDENHSEGVSGVWI
ncbi:hypothetical protein CQA66_06070 [Helicobacter aurati]|uniref:Toxin-antitoxin system YwqK family antitoxin n=1 Tax=Helicobacter aurati TaxID=137778 RepID=A0A3D8J332_9HELI|nr:hypothetical protein [Helicobacter aurati]RDU71660.1 hypothetical protein CQA66_06070 [Helicobacter aurati]